MDIIQCLGGPLIGAVIGYCTNYIAVKMLFRPRKEIRIGGFKLPFTPGVIPRRKNDLAAAVGKAVGNALLTEEDLKEMLLSEKLEESVADFCMEQFHKTFDSVETVSRTLSGITGEELYQKGKTAISRIIYEKIMNGIQEMQIGTIIAEEGKRAVQKKLEGTMFGMFLSGDLMDSMAREIGSQAENYILEKGPVYIEEKVTTEVENLENMHMYEIGEMIPADENTMKEKFRGIYKKCIEGAADSVVKQFKIAEIVENKIREMDVKELEDLVMSVMKHELGMIVNLGALIGFILGFVYQVF